MYEQFRGSLAGSLAEVQRVVEAMAADHAEPATGRLKRIESAVAKLRRDHRLSLSTIQDIAGCRTVVHGIAEQNRLLEELQRHYSGCRVVDRRAVPNSSGYRAVHLIVRSSEGAKVEIQIRTAGQHDWAQFSEILANHPNVGQAIKYGAGPAWITDRLSEMADRTQKAESWLAEIDAANAEAVSSIGRFASLVSEADPESLTGRLLTGRDILSSARANLERAREVLDAANSELDRIRAIGAATLKGVDSL